MQINTHQYQKYIDLWSSRLQDTRFLGQAAFVVIVLLISWSGVKSIQTNYALQKEITGLKQQNDLQKLENENMRLGNNYYKSNQYLELSARENFGLAMPGEKQIVVSKAVAMARTSDEPIPGFDTEPVKRSERSNIEAWVDFFLHRNLNN